MIIDIHTHIHPRRNGFGACYDATPEALSMALRESGIDKAVVLPVEPVVPTSFVLHACSELPDKLIAFASVHPQRGEAALFDLEHAVTEMGCKGLKLHPRMQGLTAAHFETIERLVSLAQRLGIPTLIDAFFYGAASYLMDSLQLIAFLSRSVPKARIIIAHMGGIKVLEALMMAKENPNLLVDLSFTPIYFQGSSIAQDLPFALKKLSAERVLFGSDFPQMDMQQSLDKAIALLDEAGFGSAEIDRALGTNARELLGI